MPKLSIGTDPEFALKRKSNGQFIAAPNVLEYFKHTPLKTKHGEIFCDNANIELTVNPASSPGEFIDNIREILTEAHEVIGKDYEIVAISGLNYPKAQLEHPYCKEFGCEPDYDAYKLAVNEVPADAAENTFRSCGGHVHVGNNDGFDFLFDPYGKIDVVKAMDVFLGLPSVYLDDSAWSYKRRNLYGKAGAHRPKDYGVEYRSLSNFWLKHPELVAFVYEMTQYAVESIKDGVFKKIPGVHRAQGYINSGNKFDAIQLFYRTFSPYPEINAEYARARQIYARHQNTPLKEAWGI